MNLESLQQHRYSFFKSSYNKALMLRTIHTNLFGTLSASSERRTIVFSLMLFCKIVKGMYTVRFLDDCAPSATYYSQSLRLLNLSHSNTPFPRVNSVHRTPAIYSPPPPSISLLHLTVITVTVPSSRAEDAAVQSRSESANAAGTVGVEGHRAPAVEGHGVCGLDAA